MAVISFIHGHHRSKKTGACHRFSWKFSRKPHTFQKNWCLSPVFLEIFPQATHVPKKLVSVTGFLGTFPDEHGIRRWFFVVGGRLSSAYQK